MNLDILNMDKPSIEHGLASMLQIKADRVSNFCSSKKMISTWDLVAFAYAHPQKDTLCKVHRCNCNYTTET